MVKSINKAKTSLDKAKKIVFGLEKKNGKAEFPLPRAGHAPGKVRGDMFLQPTS